MNRLLKLSLLTLVLNFGFTALADGGDVNSEFLHQAPEGKVEVTPGLGQGPGQTSWTNSFPNGVAFSTADVRDSSSKLNLTYVPVLVGVEYGLNSMFAFGLELGYGSASSSVSNCAAGATCKSQTQKGMVDPLLYFKGHAAAGPGAIVYGFYADMSVEKENTDSSGDSNLATGGITVTPFVAYQLPVGPGILGWRLQYDLYKGDRKFHDERSTIQDSTFTGGNMTVVDAFYEANVGIMTLGGSIFFQSESATKNTPAGGKTTDNKDASTGLGLEFYTPVHLSAVTILPQVSYLSRNYGSSESGLSSWHWLQVGAAARFAF